MLIDHLSQPGRRERLRTLQALADPTRLAVVDALATSDVSPLALAAQLDITGSLLAHHLNVLQDAGIVRRVRSEADRRRTYVQLVPDSLDRLLPGVAVEATPPRVVFVCTHNSARSQLATGLWRQHSRLAVASGGTRPAARISDGARTVARRHGLQLARSRPMHVAEVLQPDDLVVSVCDEAHEELSPTLEHRHWSVPDPVREGTDSAFERAYNDLAGRVARLAQSVDQEGTRP